MMIERDSVEEIISRVIENVKTGPMWDIVQDYAIDKLEEVLQKIKQLPPAGE